MSLHPTCADKHYRSACKNFDGWHIHQVVRVGKPKLMNLPELKTLSSLLSVSNKKHRMICSNFCQNNYKVCMAHKTVDYYLYLQGRQSSFPSVCKDNTVKSIKLYSISICWNTLQLYFRFLCFFKSVSSTK